MKQPDLPGVQFRIRGLEMIPRNTCAVEETPGQPDLIWLPKYHACWICGERTTWVELNFMAWTCPGCVDAAWRQYDEANAEQDRVYGPLDNPFQSE